MLAFASPRPVRLATSTALATGIIVGALNAPELRAQANPPPPQTAPATTPAATPATTSPTPAPSAPTPAPSAAEQSAADSAKPASSTATPASATALPTVSVETRQQKPKPQRQTGRAHPARAALPARASASAPASAAPVYPQPGPSGQVGYVATRIRTGTKTDTPLIDVPQSVTVLTKEFITDQSFQSVGDAIRYVPGVTPHQGESNRDQVVIRGQSTTADFFVDGIRDDAQYFRDFYNLLRIEVLKGPNAMIFGRGGGGGVINRVLKEADWTAVQELTAQGGQYDNKRVAIDVGQGLSDQLAGRINAVYENSDSYRRFVNIERFGFNPTVTYKPNDSTKIKLSYEYFHDDRVTDRGIPSQFDRPYQTDPSTFFGNPNLNRANVDANILSAVVEHDTDFGLKIRNASRYADYNKFYQNIYATSAVNAAGTQVALSAYNNRNDRENLFNQTDLTYKADTFGITHTLLVGTEVGRQNSDNYRQTGYFNGVATTRIVSPMFPVDYTPVVFRNNGTTDTNGFSRLDLAALYAQDQIEFNRFFQAILGIRFDRFDLDFLNRNVNQTFTRTDDLTSPRAGLIFKSFDNVSFYGSYSISYLPSAGDQFGVLATNTVLLQPEKFENREIGVRWDILPALQFASAIYRLDRFNTRATDPNNPGFFVPTGSTRTEGFEAGLTGYVTRDWQVSGGYAYTDARISSTTSTAPAGNRVPLVPRNTFSLWNKYQFTPEWAAGLGVIHQTDIYAAVDNAVLLPGFTRVDGAVFGKLSPKVRWQINVENIFNQRYYATADNNNNITPGSPRAVRATVIAKF